MEPARRRGPSHPAALEDAALLAACEERRSRSSGPGGQHRNKVETKVVLVHRATGVTGQAGERRSQPENRAMALRRLRFGLAVAVRGAEASLLPSALWRSRIRDGRISCSPHHADFPALLAEALDRLAAAGWEPRPAAEGLGCTPTQLVRFVGDHPPARILLDGERRARGLRTLR